MSCGDTLPIRYPSFVHQLTCVGNALSVWYTPVARQVEVRWKSGSTKHYPSCNRRELISTGPETHEVRIKRISSAQPVGAFSVPSPFQVLFQVLCMLKTCRGIDPTSPDKERISPHVTRRQAYKQGIRTDTNRLKIGVYVWRSSMLSDKVWHPFYIVRPGACGGIIMV